MPNRAERRHPAKIDPAVKARINAVKNGAGAADIKSMESQAEDIAKSMSEGIGPNPDQIPQDLKDALEKSGAGPNVSKLVTGKRQAKYISLERELAALLSMPALPMDKLGDTYCANHFATQGPMLAMQLTAYCESHKATYETLLRLVQAGGIITLSVAVAMYAAPPILHHTGGPDSMKSMFGVPGHKHKENNDG